MKIDELLSKSTRLSSRTLTIYSATVLAVAWTNTELKQLPGIGFLSGSEINRHVIVLLVLLFMTAIHFINFRNDILTDEGRSASEVYHTLTKALNDRESIPKHVPGTSEFLKQLEDARRRLRHINLVAREGLHLGVPMLLALAACGMLGWKIYLLATTTG